MPNPFPQSRRRSGTPARDVRRLQRQGRPRSPGPAARASPSSLVVNYEEGSELAVGDGDGLTERGPVRKSAVRPWPRRARRDLAMETM